MYTVTAKADNTNMMNTVTVIRATGACGWAAIAWAGLLAVERAAGIVPVGIAGDDGDGANGAGRTGSSEAVTGAGLGAAAVVGVNGFGGIAGLLGAATSITGLLSVEGCISRWQ